MNFPALTFVYVVYDLRNFPKFMEARILLQSQNASDLAFAPLEICLGKAEEETRKEKWKRGRMLVFQFPRSSCGRRERRKNQKF